jgi:hypothetical protein
MWGQSHSCRIFLEGLDLACRTVRWTCKAVPLKLTLSDEWMSWRETISLCYCAAISLLLLILHGCDCIYHWLTVVYINSSCISGFLRHSEISFMFSHAVLSWGCEICSWTAIFLCNTYAKKDI